MQLNNPIIFCEQSQQRAIAGRIKWLARSAHNSVVLHGEQYWYALALCAQWIKYIHNTQTAERLFTEMAHTLSHRDAALCCITIDLLCVYLIINRNYSWNEKWRLHAVPATAFQICLSIHSIARTLYSLDQVLWQMMSDVQCSKVHKLFIETVWVKKSILCQTMEIFFTQGSFLYQ